MPLNSESMKNTDTPETEAETQQALATALKHLRETKRELGALRENQKSYLERLYSGELPNHKWDGEKWIAESQENIHAYLIHEDIPDYEAIHRLRVLREEYAQVKKQNMKVCDGCSEERTKDDHTTA